MKLSMRVAISQFSHVGGWFKKTGDGYGVKNDSDAKQGAGGGLPGATDDSASAHTGFMSIEDAMRLTSRPELLRRKRKAQEP